MHLGPLVICCSWNHNAEAGMRARLSYVIKFVADMDSAVGFHRDTLGLSLKFQSPEWSEFSTGDTTLALHLASDANPAGHVELGFSVQDLKRVYADRHSNGIRFTSEPKLLHGTLLGNFVDGDGARCSISEG
jgi:hypothetical protein